MLMSLAEELEISLDGCGELIKYAQIRDWKDPSEEELKELIRRINSEWIEPFGLTEDDLVQASGLKRPYVCYLLSDLARPPSPSLQGASRGRVEVYSVLREMLTLFDEGKLREADFARVKINTPRVQEVYSPPLPMKGPATAPITLSSLESTPVLTHSDLKLESSNASKGTAPATDPLPGHCRSLETSDPIVEETAEPYTPSHHHVDPIACGDASPSAATAIEGEAEKPSDRSQTETSSTDGETTPVVSASPQTHTPNTFGGVGGHSGTQTNATLDFTMADLRPATTPLPIIMAPPSFPIPQAAPTASQQTTPVQSPPASVPIGSVPPVVFATPTPPPSTHLEVSVRPPASVPVCMAPPSLPGPSTMPLMSRPPLPSPPLSVPLQVEQTSWPNQTFPAMTPARPVSVPLQSITLSQLIPSTTLGAAPTETAIQPGMGPATLPLPGTVRPAGEDESPFLLPMRPVPQEGTQVTVGAEPTQTPVLAQMGQSIAGPAASQPLYPFYLPQAAGFSAPHPLPTGPATQPLMRVAPDLVEQQFVGSIAERPESSPQMSVGGSLKVSSVHSTPINERNATGVNSIDINQQRDYEGSVSQPPQRAMEHKHVPLHQLAAQLAGTRLGGPHPNQLTTAQPPGDLQSNSRPSLAGPFETGGELDGRNEAKHQGELRPQAPPYPSRLLSRPTGISEQGDPTGTSRKVSTIDRPQQEFEIHTGSPRVHSPGRLQSDRVQGALAGHGERSMGSHAEIGDHSVVQNSVSPLHQNHSGEGSMAFSRGSAASIPLCQLSANFRPGAKESAYQRTAGQFGFQTAEGVILNPHLYPTTEANAYSPPKVADNESQSGSSSITSEETSQSGVEGTPAVPTKMAADNSWSPRSGGMGRTSEVQEASSWQDREQTSPHIGTGSMVKETSGPATGTHLSELRPNDTLGALLHHYSHTGGKDTEEDEDSTAELVRACMVNTEVQQRRTEQVATGASGPGARGRAALERFLEEKTINRAVQRQLENACSLLLKRQHRRLQKAANRAEEVEQTIDLLVVHLEITGRAVPRDIRVRSSSPAAALLKEVSLLIAQPQRSCSPEAECLAWTLLVEALRRPEATASLVSSV